MSGVGKVVLDPSAHPDDNFHVPADDDPWWSETCWFTFTVPERDLCLLYTSDAADE